MEAFVLAQLLADAEKLLAAEVAPPSAPAALTLAPAVPHPDPEVAAGERALVSVQKEAAAVGLQLLPLRSPGDLAALLEAELLEQLVQAELRLRGLPLLDEFMLEQLLTRLDASELWSAALARLQLPSEMCVRASAATLWLERG